MEADARQACNDLDAFIARQRKALVDRVLERVRENPQAGQWQVDQPGSEWKQKALQLYLLMHGRSPTDDAISALVAHINNNGADPSVAEFLQRWAQIDLVTGVVVTGRPQKEGSAINTEERQLDPPRLLYQDWYRGRAGQCHHLPAQILPDSDEWIERFVLHGWVPSEPIITPASKVTALGSCFADEMRIWLREKGIAVNADERKGTAYPHVEDFHMPILQCAAGLVNTFVLRQQFDWALGGVEFPSDLWVAGRGSVVVPTEAARRRTKEVLERTDVFILTLGLSEVWYRRAERPGQREVVMWRAVPAEMFTEETHGFRTTTVAENVENLSHICDLIWRTRMDAAIVLTLSPVPLSATFRGVSAISANAASKACLRASVDEVLARHAGKRLFYWPAYEVVKEVFGQQAYLPDGRHVKPEIVRRILRLFGKWFVRESCGTETANEGPPGDDDLTAGSSPGPLGNPLDEM